MKPLRPLIAILGLLLPLLATAPAQEILHVILQNGAGCGYCHGMYDEDMKQVHWPPEGTHPDSRLRHADGSFSEPQFHGRVPAPGASPAEISGRFHSGNEPKREVNDMGITMNVTKTGDCFSFNVDILASQGGPTFARFRASGVTALLRPNQWQQVCHFGLSWVGGMWCFLESPGAPVAPPAAAEEDTPLFDPASPYRLEVRYGHLPEETLQRMGSFGREHLRLAVKEMAGELFVCRHLCQSGKPFTSTSGLGEFRRIGDDAYHDSTLSSLEGTLTVEGSHAILKSVLYPAATRRSKAAAFPFEGELKPGRWRLVRVENGPATDELRAFSGDDRFDTRGSKPINVAAFRITKAGDE